MIDDVEVRMRRGVRGRSLVIAALLVVGVVSGCSDSAGVIEATGRGDQGGQPYPSIESESLSPLSALVDVADREISPDMSLRDVLEGSDLVVSGLVTSTDVVDGDPISVRATVAIENAVPQGSVSEVVVESWVFLSPEGDAVNAKGGHLLEVGDRVVALLVAVDEGRYVIYNLDTVLVVDGDEVVSLAPKGRMAELVSGLSPDDLLDEAQSALTSL